MSAAPVPAPSAGTALQPDASHVCVTAYLDGVEAHLAATVTSVGAQWDAVLGDEPVGVFGGVPLSTLLIKAARTTGKRLRPSLAYWGWVAAGGEADAAADVAGPSQDGGQVPEELTRLGTALELLHLFALVHDDVMDEAATRRGQPTVHALVSQAHRRAGASGDSVRFGDSVAVLVGDAAHAIAEDLAADLPRPVQRIWRATVLELVAGQSLDLVGAAERRTDGDRPATIAWLKSGAYTIARPLAMGAALAAPGAEPSGLSEYGRQIGVAFALRDDLLGVWGQEASTGKPTGSDLLQGKATAVMALGRQRLCGRPGELVELAAAARLAPTQVPVLVEALEQAGVRESVEALVDQHVAAGLAAIHGSPRLTARGVAGLTEVALRVAWRDR